MIDHTDVVRQVKTQLEARGVSLAGPDGAFAITRRVAWALRAEGAGLLEKTAGNNSGGFATDIICYPSGQIVDILTDGGATNGPQWAVGEILDASRYRPAFNPGDDAPAPAPDPVVVPPTGMDLSEVVAKLNAVLASNARIESALAQPHPPLKGPFGWTFRP